MRECHKRENREGHQGPWKQEPTSNGSHHVTTEGLGSSGGGVFSECANGLPMRRGKTGEEGT